MAFLIALSIFLAVKAALGILGLRRQHDESLATLFQVILVGGRAHV